MLKTIAIDLMESRINRIIDIIRSLKEESIANVVGDGGLTNAAIPPGRLDGYNKLMGKLIRKRGPVIGLGKNSRNRWKTPPQP